MNRLPDVPRSYASRPGLIFEAIPAWIEEGRLRRARAGLPPFSGGTRP